MSESAVSDRNDSQPMADDEAPKPRRLAPVVVFVVGVVLAGFLWILISAPSGETKTAPTRLKGRVAPAIVTKTLDGTQFDLSRRKGSWVYLNFFQSNCVECVAEHPELVRFVEQQQALGSSGAEFYSVIWNDPAENVRAFFRENGGTWPVLYDDDASIAVDFGVAQVPETWLIDPNGVVVERLIGASTAAGLTNVLEQYQALSSS